MGVGATVTTGVGVTPGGKVTTGVGVTLGGVGDGNGDDDGAVDADTVSALTMSILVPAVLAK